MKQIKIAISTIFQNAGDAMRAIEIAKGIREYAPKDIEPDITFVSRGGKFENIAEKLGFNVYRTTPRFYRDHYQHDFKTGFGELIGDTQLAREILEGEIEAYNNLQPDFLLYGFWPVASIARRMVIPKVPHAAFLPLPLTESFINSIKSFPDEVSDSTLPVNLQRSILNLMPKSLKSGLLALRYKCIRNAAEQLGWKGEELSNMFSMLRSELYLVNDFRHFYENIDFSGNVVFTGPVFSITENTEITDANISSVLDENNKRIKIFCTLGSSGNKETLKEIIHAFNTEEGMQWSGILLSPRRVCPIEESIQCSKNSNLYITDEFVPATEINKHVDLVICHGGQGTLNTAITGSAPVIGIATRPEQKINLENLQNFGSAIRIPQHKWNCNNIVNAVNTIIDNDTYKQKAEMLSNLRKSINTNELIAEKIWGKIRA